jgi:hypothetical protein
MAPSDNFWENEELVRPETKSFNRKGDKIRGTLQHMEMQYFGEGEERRAVPSLFIGPDLESSVMVRPARSLVVLLQKLKPGKGDDIEIELTGETPLRGPGNRTELHWRLTVNGEVVSN